MTYFREATNQDRAGWAAHAVAHYQNVKRCGDECHDTIVQDLITDLLHSLEDADATTVLRLAMGNYEEEVEEESS